MFWSLQSHMDTIHNRMISQCLRLMIATSLRRRPHPSCLTTRIWISSCLKSVTNQPHSTTWNHGSNDNHSFQFSDELPWSHCGLTAKYQGAIEFACGKLTVGSWKEIYWYTRLQTCASSHFAKFRAWMRSLVKLTLPWWAAYSRGSWPPGCSGRQRAACWHTETIWYDVRKSITIWN